MKPTTRPATKPKALTFKVGDKVRVKAYVRSPRYGWGEDRWEECAPGIHFFLTREEAEAYN